MWFLAIPTSFYILENVFHTCQKNTLVSDTCTFSSTLQCIIPRVASTYILLCALFCRAIVLDGCSSCKLLSDACTHHSSLLLLTCQGKGAGTEPLQELTNTSNFLTHVCKHPTDRGSINKRFVTCCYPRIVGLGVVSMSALTCSKLCHVT